MKENVDFGAVLFNPDMHIIIKTTIFTLVFVRMKLRKTMKTKPNKNVFSPLQ